MNKILKMVHETPYSMSLTIILLTVMTILLVRKYHTTNERKYYTTNEFAGAIFIKSIFIKSIIKSITGCLRILFSVFFLTSALALINLGWNDYQSSKIFKYTITCVGVVEQTPGIVNTTYRVDDFQINDDGTVTFYRSCENIFITVPFLEITKTFPYRHLTTDELRAFRR